MGYLGDIFKKLDNEYNNATEILIFKFIAECEESNLYITDSYYNTKDIKYVINELIKNIDKNMKVKIGKIVNFSKIEFFIEFYTKDECFNDEEDKKIFEMEYKLLRGSNEIKPTLDNIKFWICTLHGDEELKVNTTGTLRDLIKIVNEDLDLERFELENLERLLYM